MSDMTHKLKNLEIFQSFSERQLKEISQNTTLYHAKNREILFREEDPLDQLYLILYGSLKVQKTLKGEPPVILNFLGRGEFLGISMVELTSPTYAVTGVAIEESALLTFSRPFFREVLMRTPQVRQAVHQQLSTRFLEFQNDRCMEHAHLPQRLADFLVRMWERQPAHFGTKILIPFTRKDISQRLGTHTETVIRTLSNWSKKDIITTIDHHIEILDLHRLKELRHERTSH